MGQNRTNKSSHQNIDSEGSKHNQLLSLASSGWGGEQPLLVTKLRIPKYSFDPLKNKELIINITKGRKKFSLFVK